MQRRLLDFALCHADTAGVHAFSSVSAQTSCTPATSLYAGVEPAHTRICSILSCDVFTRVVWIKPCGRDRLYLFALPTSRTCLPRSAPCDSVAYAEGVQKRKAFLFLSFSYFSDKRKVHGAFRTFRTGEKYIKLLLL